MMRFSGWVMSAGLAIAATSAQAQVPGAIPDPVAGRLVTTVSDFDGPYAAMPPEAAGRGYSYDGYGHGPSLLPPSEVYSVLRESGFLPLGIPRQRGFVYTIEVTDHRGDNGRLVIDARDGRIVRFVPDGRFSDIDNGPPVIYGPGEPPPIGSPRSELRPLPSEPRLASRTPAVPLPKAAPARSGEARPQMKSELKPEIKPAVKSEQAKPAEPPQQSAAIQVKPADVAPATPPPPAAKPDAPQILPTQEMPKVQGLD